MTVKGTILIDPFPATGHINASITLARFLASQGFHIWFSGFQDFKKKISDEGFDYYVISSFLFTPTEVEIEEKGRLKFMLENVGRSRFRRIQKEYEKTASDYDRMMDVIKPDLILLDDHYAQKAFHFKKYQIPVITVQTMILPKKSKNVPPFQSTYIPGKGRLSEIYIELLWKKKFLTRSFEDFTNKLLALGNTNLRILRKLCPAPGLGLDYNRCYGVGISELPMITTSPKTFDFPHAGGHPGVYYFGKQESDLDKKIEDGRLLSLLLKVDKQKKTELDKILIYCSLGTVKNAGDKTRQKFFIELISVAAQKSHIEFILSIGKHFNVNNLPQIPENLHLFASVPQKQLLKHVDIMITHGGINSIKECIDAEVPTINYPLTDKWDQPGNAARASFHNLGLQGNIKRATARSILKKIKTILEERESFRSSLRDMKQKIRESNRSEEKEILELIFQLTETESKQIKVHHEIH